MVEVYFDDFKVEHIKSPVISSQNYYPFGLTFNSYQRENSTPNQFQYNGSEQQDELGLGWFDYGARMYMPDLGRWGVIDPKSEKSITKSPYNYALNNPIKFIDRAGKEVEIYWIGFAFGDPQGHVAIVVRGSAVEQLDRADKEGATHLRYYPNGQGNNRESNGWEPDPNNPERAYETKGYALLGSDMKDYLDDGRKIERVTFKLPPKVEAALSAILAGLNDNVNVEDRYGSGGGTRLRNILIEAFKDAGYSQSAAEAAANKIIPGNTPTRTNTDAGVWKNSGAKSYELVRKDGDRYGAGKREYGQGTEEEDQSDGSMTLDQFKKAYPELYKTLFGSR